jgi:alginate O-acetyltransferase complex protein AlgI
MTVVFCFVSTAWLLFRLPHFSDVQAYLSAVISNIHMPPSWGAPLVIALYSAPVVIYHLHYLIRRANPAAESSRWRPVIFGAMLMLIALDSGPRAAFIYFQF